jgi:CRISPR-associated protein Cmr5
MDNATIRTKQQERATFALDELKNVQITKELANFIVGMPTMILSNGLGQTMAFLMAKMDKNERSFVFDVIKKYLRKNYKNDFPSDNDNNKEFMMSFNNINFYKLIEMQNDVLKMLEWLKRYARAF